MEHIHVVAHPLASARLSALRSSETSTKDFRAGIHQLSTFLGIEASRDLEQSSFEGSTPIAPFTGSRIKPRIAFTPILRAGLGMTEAMLELFPDAHVYHIGLFREKISLQPVEYYSKLPANPAIDLVYLLDPLIATGGTARAALQMLVDWGIPISNIRLLSILVSEQGLRNIRSEFPDLKIWTIAVDPVLTPNGLIAPGLGDTGDRLFNTLQ